MTAADLALVSVISGFEREWPLYISVCAKPLICCMIYRVIPIDYAKLATVQRKSEIPL
ncbi:hypothetical protein NBRC116587_04180 [Pseudoteredinibacter isoporae]